MLIGILLLANSKYRGYIWF